MKRHLDHGLYAGALPWIALLSAALLQASCGSYDAEYDCEQTLACVHQQTDHAVTTEDEIAECAGASASVYDVAEFQTRATVDRRFEECRERQACDYVDCIHGKR